MSSEQKKLPIVQENRAEFQDLEQATLPARDSWIADLQLVRAFDLISIGMLMEIVILYGNRPFMAMPVPFIKFVYVAPLALILWGIFRIPSGLILSPDWSNTLWRLRWSSVLTIGMSPFWGWWNAAQNNSYCIINVGFLCLVAFLGLFNLAGLGRVLAVSRQRPWLLWLSRLTRLTIIYGMIAPLLAVFLIAWYRNHSGQVIFVFLSKLGNWKLFFLGMPAAMTLLVVLSIRQLQTVLQEPDP